MYINKPEKPCISHPTLRAEQANSTRADLHSFPLPRPLVNRGVQSLQENRHLLITYIGCALVGLFAEALSTVNLFAVERNGRKI